MLPARPLLALATCFSIVPVGASAQTRDTIVARDGRRIGVDEVLADTFREVRYRLASREAAIPAAEVERIEYRDEPLPLRQAREKLSAGDPDAALRLLEIETSGARPWVAEAVAFERANALEQWGTIDPRRYEEAASAYDAFGKQFAESRRLPEALLGRARSLASSTRRDEALAAFEGVASRSEDFGFEVQIRALLGRAETLLAMGRTAEARGETRGLETRIQAMNHQGEAFAPYLSRARLLQGDAMLAEGNADEARRFFSSLAQEGPAKNPWLYYGARTGEGEALLRLSKPREAILSLSEVVALEPYGFPFSARATYDLGECWKALIGIESEAERRAQSYWSDVLKLYPGTPWSAKARVALGPSAPK